MDLSISRAVERSADFQAIFLCVVFMLNGWLFRHVRLSGALATNAVLLSLTQLSEKAEQSDNDGRDADGDVDNGCRRVRTHDNPEDSTACYSERDEISQYRVTHGVASMPVGRLHEPENQGCRCDIQSRRPRYRTNSIRAMLRIHLGGRLGP
jgi:hypothetical protein